MGESGKVFSIPEIGVWMDEREYIIASDLIGEAAGLAGDGAGGELGLNSEYERGMAELILRFMGWPVEEIGGVISAIHKTAIENSNRRES